MYRMGAAGRCAVAARFGLERMLEELQGVYDRLSARGVPYSLRPKRQPGLKAISRPPGAGAARTRSERSRDRG